MIINVSGRTDIVAFYPEWFMKRYKMGFVDVRNPFYPNQVSRIYFEDVDAILFCTKNPHPILKYLPLIKKPIIFQVTLTPYKNDIEPNVFHKLQVIEDIKTLSEVVGIDFLSVRYDPIFISEKYSIVYHIKAFEKMCILLKGYVKRIIISFIDEYKNVQRNLAILNYQTLSEDDYREIGLNFSEIAKKNDMQVQTCFEEHNLVEYGFTKAECVSHELAYILTGKTNYKNWSARKAPTGNANCGCVQMVDIGAYNSCLHLCKYCYANFDEQMVKTNHLNHDVNSSLLIGTLKSADIIKRRLK